MLCFKGFLPQVLGSTVEGPHRFVGLVAPAYASGGRVVLRRPRPTQLDGAPHQEVALVVK